MFISNWHQSTVHAILRILTPSAPIHYCPTNHGVRNDEYYGIVKWLNGTAPHGKPISELRSVTRHMRSHPTQVNDSQIGRYSIYLPRKDARLSWPWWWYIPRWSTCPQTVTHKSSIHLIITRPEVEPTTSRSQVQRPNRYTTQQAVRLSSCLPAVEVLRRCPVTAVVYCWRRWSWRRIV